MGIEAAIVGFVTSIGLPAAVGSAIYLIGQAALLAAAAGALAKRALDGSPDMGSRALSSRGTVDPAKIIYGEALVGGTLAYKNALGLKNRELWVVHVIAGHEVEEISDVYLDSRLIQNSEIASGASAGGQVDSGDFGPVRNQSVVEIYKYYGTSSQTYNVELGLKTSDWTTAHTLRGHAYAVTMFALWDKVETLWESGDPQNVKFLVKGKKIYDPRLDDTQIIDDTTSPVTYGSGSHRTDDDTTWEWSDNPALCTADYLLDSKFSPFAGGLTAARIDWKAVATSADICDELVPIPPDASPQNTEKRYTCNGVIWGTAKGEENIAHLLSSMNGELTLTNGLYVIQAAAYSTPDSSDVIDEGMIIGPVQINSALSTDERINTLKAQYVDPDKEYQTTETAPITFSALKDTRDGGNELIDTLELPMTNSWYMAQRICQIRLQQANQELQVSVPCNLKAMRLVPGQRVNLTLTERGWTPKVFRVLSWEYFDTGQQIGVNVMLREDASAAYDDPEVSEYNTVDGNGTITLGTPTLIPSVRSLPRKYNVGVGSWNIRLYPNELGDGSSNDGEVALGPGVYQLADRQIRTLTERIEVNTPWEGSFTAPEFVGYLIWGATSVDTRFASSPTHNFGPDAAEGIFAAFYDRTRDVWYAQPNNSADSVEFTMLDTDYIIAELSKESSTGGLDSAVPLVPFVADPIAVLPGPGTNLILDGTFSRSLDWGRTDFPNPYWAANADGVDYISLNETGDENGGPVMEIAQNTGAGGDTYLQLPGLRSCNPGDTVYIQYKFYLTSGVGGDIWIKIVELDSQGVATGTVHTCDPNIIAGTNTWNQNNVESFEITDSDCRNYAIRVGCDASEVSGASDVLRFDDITVTQNMAGVGVVNDNIVTHLQALPVNTATWITNDGAIYEPACAESSTDDQDITIQAIANGVVASVVWRWTLTNNASSDADTITGAFSGSSTGWSAGSISADNTRFPSVVITHTLSGETITLTAAALNLNISAGK